jgi:hypothetical protein
MFLEYLADARPDGRPVLLTYGSSPSAAAVLQDVAARLAASEHHTHIAVDELPEFQGLNGCTLSVETGPSAIGLTPIQGAGHAFRCVLDPPNWLRVAGLIEPFTTQAPEIAKDAFQYLDESGPIDWILSGSRSW